RIQRGREGLLRDHICSPATGDWSVRSVGRVKASVSKPNNGLLFPECGVTLCDPVFDLVVKFVGLNKDLLRFGLGRYVGEGIVDSISLSPTGLKVVGILVSGFSQHKFRAF